MRTVLVRKWNNEVVSMSMIEHRDSFTVQADSIQFDVYNEEAMKAQALLKSVLTTQADDRFNVLYDLQNDVEVNA